ncbi:hypothetical protein GIB67_016330 [Kingdonia uniflora]|uniref:Glycosyltransferase n=1 Tax=Kingdonia uniflora TaxID=39325 RepID=A0A7J7M9T8_9MAGN|nr:hypothetical protein GIB67_016330 [Kingdonia uniflora]
MGSEGRQLHFFYFPFMAQGHMIPMVDIAKLLAHRGVKGTIITTPLNALLISRSIEGERKSGINLGIEIMKFPSAEAGLPEGCDNVDIVTTREMAGSFFKAVSMLKQPLKMLLEKHRVDCLVADMFFTWTTDVAGELGIPRLVFHGTSLFSLCVGDSIDSNAPHKTVESDVQPFVVPGLPDQIEMTKSELSDHTKTTDTNSPFAELIKAVRKSEVTSFGVVANSFYELEPAYADHYRKAMGRRAWHIGPVSLCNRNTADKAQRGKNSTIDENYCLNWLDSKELDSVIYVSFGSMGRFSAIQLLEIATGLEASNVPFIWVVRKSREGAKELCLPDGFQERMEGKGLIIRDWAPQVLILDHPAIGGFVTHCGWNSTLEAVCAGVPMIAWPLSAEQFYNEKLITDILRIGIPAGPLVWSSFLEAIPEAALVKSEKVEMLVTQLMGSGGDTTEMRRRAKVLREMANKAVEKGGSSYKDLNRLIDDIRMHNPLDVCL